MRGTGGYMYKYIIGTAVVICAAALAVRAVQIRIKRRESIIEVK